MTKKISSLILLIGILTVSRDGSIEIGYEIPPIGIEFRFFGIKFYGR